MTNRLCLLAGVLLAPFVLLNVFNQPSKDDFVAAVSVAQHGVVGSVVHEYQHWGGRFVAYLAFGVLEHAVPRFHLYALESLVFQIILGSSFLFCFNEVFARPLGWHWSWGLVGLAVILARLPSPAEGLYWLTGYMAYTFPAAMLLVLLALVARQQGWSIGQHAPQGRSSLGSHLLALLLIVIVVGCNETCAVLLLGLLSLAIAARVIEARAVPWRLVWYVAFGLAVFAVSVLAPGNAARMQVVDTHQSVWVVLGKYVAGSARHFLRFLGLAQVGVLLLAWRTRARWAPRLSHRFCSWSVRRWLILTFVAVILVPFLPGYYAMGARPPARAINVLLFFHNLSLFLVVLSWMGEVVQRDTAPEWLRTRWFSLPAAEVLLALGLLVGRQGRAYYDLAFKAADYQRQFAHRYEQIRRSPGGDLVVPRLHDPPRTIYVGDIERDPTHWKNVSYAQFFGLTSIRADGDPP